VSCNATRILASRGTLTGSIGVLAPLPLYGELLDKVGYHTRIVKSARFKDIGNPEREMTEAERRIFQETVDAVHEQFVQHISEGRGIPLAEVRKIADGRMLTGEHAHALNLVDGFGNFEDAVRLAAELSDIKGEPEIVYAEKEEFSLLSLLLGEATTDRLNTILEKVEVLTGSTAHPLRYQAPMR
jgi:protease-4